MPSLVEDEVNRRDEGGANQSIDIIEFQSWLQSHLKKTLELHQNDLKEEIVKQFDTFADLIRHDVKEASRPSLLRKVLQDDPVPKKNSGRASGVRTVDRKSQVGPGNSEAPVEDKLQETSCNLSVEDVEHKVVTAMKAHDMGQATKHFHTSLQESIKAARAIHTPSLKVKEKLDIISTIVIVLNVAFMLIEMEFQGRESRASLGIVPPFDWQGAENAFDVVEHIFNVIFIIEIVIRMYLDRCAYFSDRANFLDLFLIGFTSLQLYVLKPLELNVGETITIFRVLRIFRFVRLLKVMRLPVFADLRVLIFTCISSMAALFWSMVLLFIAMFVSALAMCNLLKDAIQDESKDHKFRQWLYEYYGTTARSFYTMFEVTLAGCWPTYFRPLVQKVSIGYAAIAVLYITVVVFAVIRIITALFLKETLQVAASDSEMQVNEKKAKTRKNLEKLRKVFEAIDVEGDGVLHWEEFTKVTANPNVVILLESFDLALHDLQSLWDLLDDGDGTVTYDEFIQGVSRLKGQARSLDVLAISRQCDLMRQTLTIVTERLTTIETRV